MLWKLFQAAIVGFWLWIDYKTGDPPRPGLALTVGVIFAFALTAMLISIWELWLLIVRKLACAPKGLDKSGPPGVLPNDGSRPRKQLVRK